MSAATEPVKTILSPRHHDDGYYPKQELAAVFAQRGYSEETIKYRVIKLEKPKHAHKIYLCEVSTPNGPFYSECEKSVLDAEMSAAFIAMRALARAQQFRRAKFAGREVPNSMSAYCDDLANMYINKQHAHDKLNSSMPASIQRSKRTVIQRKKRLSLGELGILEDDSSSSSTEEDTKAHSKSLPPTSPRGEGLKTHLSGRQLISIKE